MCLFVIHFLKSPVRNNFSQLFSWSDKVISVKIENNNKAKQSDIDILKQVLR